MQRFVCEQNVAHFEKLLSETSDFTVQRTLQSLLASARRELALLNSARTGADASPFEQRRRQQSDAAAIRQQFQPEFDGSPHPYMLLDPGPGLHIIDINDAYAAATLTQRSDRIQPRSGAVARLSHATAPSSDRSGRIVLRTRA